MQTDSLKSQLSLFTATLLVHLGLLLVPLLNQKEMSIAPLGMENTKMTVRMVKAPQNHRQKRPKPIQPKPKKINKKHKKIEKIKKEVIEQTVKKQQKQGQKIGSFEQLIKNYVNPRYPRLALKRGIQGEVQLKIFVDEKGMVTQVEVLKSSGHSILDHEAIRAAKQWQFKPSKSFTITKNVDYIIKSI